MTPARRKTLIEINHYCKTNSILVVNEQGQLQMLFCPIMAYYIDDRSTVLFIAEIKTNEELELLYLVGGKLFSHDLFILKSSSQ